MLWACCILLAYATLRNLQELRGWFVDLLPVRSLLAASSRPYSMLQLHTIFWRLHGLLASSYLQTSIQTEGFRSLAEGEPVEYYLEAGDDGRTKAVQVTGPAGAPPQVSLQYTLYLSVSSCHLFVSPANHTCCDCTVRQLAMVKLSQV